MKPCYIAHQLYIVDFGDCNQEFVVILIRKLDTNVNRLLMKALRHHLSDKDQTIDLITKHLHNNSLRVFGKYYSFTEDNMTMCQKHELSIMFLISHQ